MLDPVTLDVVVVDVAAVVGDDAAVENEFKLEFEADKCFDECRNVDLFVSTGVYVLLLVYPLVPYVDDLMLRPAVVTPLSYVVYGLMYRSDVYGFL